MNHPNPDTLLRLLKLLYEKPAETALYAPRKAMWVNAAATTNAKTNGSAVAKPTVSAANP